MIHTYTLLIDKAAAFMETTIFVPFLIRSKKNAST